VKVALFNEYNLFVRFEEHKEGELFTDFLERLEKEGLEIFPGYEFSDFLARKLHAATILISEYIAEKDPKIAQRDLWDVAVAQIAFKTAEIIRNERNDRKEGD
jgi:hypothetical protein